MAYESVEEYGSFWDHIEDLRRTLKRILLVIVFGICVSFCFHEAIIRGLTSPLSQQFFHLNTSIFPEKVETYRFSNAHLGSEVFRVPSETIDIHVSAGVKSIGDRVYEVPPGESIRYVISQPSTQLIVLGPLEGVMIALKTSIWMGIVITSPFWLWIAFQFILPALTVSEVRLIFPFFLVSTILIVLGLLFSFYVTIPLANGYLSAFNQAIGMNLWSLSQYLDYTLFLLLANAIAFEFAAVGLIAVHAGVLGVEWLTGKRRVAIVLAFVVGALLTPPDILTQLMLAVPLIIFYEMIILYARLCRR